MNTTTNTLPTIARTQDCAPFDVDTPASNALRNMQRVHELAMRGIELGEMLADRRAINAAREAFWTRWNSGQPTDHAAIAMAKRAA
jgi:hypothetical protein